MPRKKTQKDYGSLLEQFGMKPYKKKAREKYMSKPQLKHFKKLLLAWKEQLEIEAEETVKHLKTDSNNLADPNDRATHESHDHLDQPSYCCQSLNVLLFPQPQFLIALSMPEEAF